MPSRVDYRLESSLDISIPRFLTIPKGFQPIAGGQRSATTGPAVHKMISIPAGIAAASVQVAIIEFDPSPLEQLHQFLTEASSLVMLPLIFDIASHTLACRRTDGECCVALLPCEAVLVDFGMDPDRAGPFQFPHHIRQAMRGLEADEQMDMIFDPADL